MAENKKSTRKVWITTNHKTQSKPSPSKTDVVKEISSSSEKISESGVDKFRHVGKVEGPGPCGDKK